MLWTTTLFPCGISALSIVFGPLTICRPGLQLLHVYYCCKSCWTVTWLVPELSHGCPSTPVGKYQLRCFFTGKFWRWFRLALVTLRAAPCSGEGWILLQREDWCNLLQHLQILCCLKVFAEPTENHCRSNERTSPFVFDKVAYRKACPYFSVASQL